MVLHEYFKKGGPVLPTLWTSGEQANTESLGESSEPPEGKLSRLETSTIATYRKGMGKGMGTREVRY